MTVTALDKPWRTTSPNIVFPELDVCTRTSAVADRPRDASCLASTILLVLWLHIYQCIKLNSVLCSSAYPSTDKNDIDTCCHKQDLLMRSVRRPSAVINKRRLNLSLLYTRLQSYRPQSQISVKNRRSVAIMFGMKKTRMVWLHDAAKVWGYAYSFWQNTRTWQTDRQTPRDGIGYLYA